MLYFIINGQCYRMAKNLLKFIAIRNLKNLNEFLLRICTY